MRKRSNLRVIFKQKRNSDIKELRFLIFRGIITQRGDRMTLQEAKDLLSKNNIYFDICKFESEAEYWHHISLFPYTKNAKNCKVIALIIMSNNGQKNIELQFNAVKNEFRFEELHFGDYSFEMFDYKLYFSFRNLAHSVDMSKLFSAA